MQKDKRKIEDYIYQYKCSETARLKEELQRLNLLGKSIVLLGKTFCTDEYNKVQVLSRLFSAIDRTAIYQDKINKLAYLYPQINYIDFDMPKYMLTGDEVQDRLNELEYKSYRLQQVYYEYAGQIQ